MSLLGPFKNRYSPIRSRKQSVNSRRRERADIASEEHGRRSRPLNWASYFRLSGRIALEKGSNKFWILTDEPYLNDLIFVYSFHHHLTLVLGAHVRLSNRYTIT